MHYKTASGPFLGWRYYTWIWAAHPPVCFKKDFFDCVHILSNVWTYNHCFLLYYNIYWRLFGQLKQESSKQSGFLAMLAARHYRWQSQSIGWSTTLVQTEISKQLLGRLLNFMQTFVVPWRWILMSLVILWLFFSCHREIHICGFEWNSSTSIGWIAMKFHTNIHVSLRMNYNNFIGRLIFHLASNILIYDLQN